MRIQIARTASSLIAQRRDAMLHDGSLPLTVRGTANVHFDKPWIPKFWAVAISAAGRESSRSQSYFDFPIGHAEDGTLWHFPSKDWWIAHANVSHSPEGMGCDVDVHTKFLSSEGAAHEFDYATIFTDETMKVLGRADFVDERAWWTRAFGARGGDKP